MHGQKNIKSISVIRVAKLTIRIMNVRLSTWVKILVKEPKPRMKSNHFEN